jgi:flagellar biosynthetic protein FlhB
VLERLRFISADVFGQVGTLRLDTVDNVAAAFAAVMKNTFLSILPLMVAVLAVGVIANVAQVGLVFSSESLAFNLSKLNPLSGIKRLVSLRSLVEWAKALLKMLIIGTVSYLALRSQVDRIPALVQAPVYDILVFTARAAGKICFHCCLALAGLAALDYGFQRRQHAKELRMTKQEIKDELRQSEGDPKIKARIRAVQLEMARKRMMVLVPRAAVVITNPSHLAVALEYRMEEMAAPRVVAKGAGFIAERIKDIARANGIPIVENKPLARTLFKAVDVGRSIPEQLYKAVAEVLAYVYRLQNRRSPGAAP